MKYNDEIMPNDQIVEKMNDEFNVFSNSQQIEVCQMGEYRQKAEIEEIYRLLNYCESFFKWLESEDGGSIEEIKKLLEKTISDKVVTEGCCGRSALDYRYACEKDFNHNCTDYCKCELEIIDRVIKILTLKNSIIDKQCMMKLLQSRMDTLKFIFHKYCK